MSVLKHLKETTTTLFNSSIGIDNTVTVDVFNTMTQAHVDLRK